MRRFLYSIVLASATLLPTSCDYFQSKDGKKGKGDSLTTILTDNSLEYTELAKVPLPCSKEALSAAWKLIESTSEVHKRKALDYKQHLPILFISTDLDGDEVPEVLLRSDPPYAAIYSYAKDTLNLITFVDHERIGLGITPDGIIMRNGSNRDGALISQFIRLENSLPAAKGETREKFAIQNNEMVSTGTEYALRRDTATVKVSKEEYEKVAPKKNGTYLEDIDGWEDFRKP